jgi:RHS repeat-associated protein
VVGTSQYDPYGRRVQHSGTADSAMGYAGQWTDPSTGLLYLRARDYDSDTGQFLTVDPALDQTHQPYTYADNNPLTLTDPSGLSATDWLNHTLTSGAGGVNHLVDALSSGASCTYKHDGWYLSGEITGTLAPVALTGGAAIYQELRVASELDTLTTCSGGIPGRLARVTEARFGGSPSLGAPRCRARLRYRGRRPTRGHNVGRNCPATYFAGRCRKVAHRTVLGVCLRNAERGIGSTSVPIKPRLCARRLYSRGGSRVRPAESPLR